jgi:hypothetical protein
MSLLALPNPFLTQKLDHTLSVPPGDVPELHTRVLEKCRTALAQARQSNQSIGLLVVGETGSGKSHLIAQLRRPLVNDPQVVLAVIPLRGAYQGRLWRHLRERLVNELFQEYPGRTDRLSGLLRILGNRFPKWAAGRDSSQGILDLLLGRNPRNDNLPAALGAFAHSCELDYGLQKVLPQLFNPQLTNCVQDWLRGKILGNEDLTALGLPPVFPSEQEQETNARDVVLSLFRLAGEATSLFVCFDEVEAIQAGNQDATTFRQFTTLATDLLAQPGPRVVATFIRPETQMAVKKAVDKSNLDKMSQDMATLPPLAWEHVIRLTTSRLEAQPHCRDARREHPDETVWPLAPSFVQRLFDQNKRSLTPRHLIRACAVEFERLQKVASPNGDGKAAEAAKKPHTAAAERKSLPTGGDAESTATALIELDHFAPAPAAEEFARMWERQRKKFVTRPQAIAFDTTMAIGLPWLVALTEAPLVWTQDRDPRLGDVNLVFQSKTRRGPPLGISLCNQEPRLLWHRLDRIHKQWTAAKGKSLGSLVLLRSENERTTATADARLKTLTEQGVRVIRVAHQQLAELAAFQTMLTAAHAGDLTRSGKPVETAEYDTWAKGALSAAVKELFDLIFEQ